MDQKVTLPESVRKRIWWFITASLYFVSTIGLVSGLNVGFEMSVSGVEGVTIPAGAALLMALIVGVVFQSWETMIILDWDESDLAERTFGIGMLLIDTVALFLALGGHLNIIWMSQNAGNAPGMITHTLGLSTQILAALLGSVGAELALRRSLKVAGIKPVTREVRAPTKVFNFSRVLESVRKMLRPARRNPFPAGWKVEPNPFGGFAVAPPNGRPFHWKQGDPLPEN